MNRVAALFDWDGVVIDSSAQHEKSWELLAAETGLPLPPDHFTKGFGKKNEVIIPEILGWSSNREEIIRLGHRKEELYRQLVGEAGVTVLPGARELLLALRAAAIPCAVGSSTPRNNLIAIFAATGLGEFFDAVVCGDDVTHGKPAPDVFLQAAQLLHMQPCECVVLEDAFAGIEAGQRAGMKVIGVATTHPVSELTMADWAVTSLVEVTPESLRALLSR